jgi:hypothetical protein
MRAAAVDTAETAVDAAHHRRLSIPIRLRRRIRTC